MAKFFLLIIIFFLNVYSQNLITPIPLKDSYDKKAAAVGKKLFFDKRLSKSDSITCGTCHIKKNYFCDNKKTPTGADGYRFKRNTPTLLNIRYNYYYEWDGKISTLHECIVSALINRHETAMSPSQIAKKLKNTEYKAIFEKNFKDGLTANNVVVALKEYIKSLTTPNSKFDRFLRGEKNAISKKAKKGYELFISKGCVACHNGVLLGGNLITKFGFMKRYDTKDLGRYEYTKDPEDKHFFKVPSLRNISKTYPYLHDGSVKSLKKVVKIMLGYQLSVIYTEEEVEAIVEFLKTLDGELPDD